LYRAVPVRAPIKINVVSNSAGILSLGAGVRTSCGRYTSALFDVSGASRLIVLSAGELVGEPMVYLAGIRRVFLKSLYQFFHGTSAPTTTGSCSLAFRKLAWDFDSVDANEVDYLPPRNMKAQTKIVISFHPESLFGQCRMPLNSLRPPTAHWSNGRCVDRIPG
jgi:hypothetical protein